MDKLDYSAFGDLLAQEIAGLSADEKYLFDAIQVPVARWQLSPWGDPFDGFWAVGVIGRQVIWYNNIEEGFNSSQYDTYGVIKDYWCDQDELSLTVRKVQQLIVSGEPSPKLGEPRPIR